MTDQEQKCTAATVHRIEFTDAQFKTVEPLIATVKKYQEFINLFIDYIRREAKEPSKMQWTIMYDGENDNRPYMCGIEMSKNTAVGVEETDDAGKE